MIRIGLLGATGRMGRLIAEEIVHSPGVQLAAAVGRGMGRQVQGVPVGRLESGCFSGVDVVIDVSLPEGFLAALPYLGALPVVSGSTGWTPIDAARRDAFADGAPLLVASNFSPGIAWLRAALAHAGGLAAQSIAIVETHHAAKRDAPSGTATALAQTLGRTDVAIHALRGGDEIGEHEVRLLLAGEELTLTHRATDRRVFAVGALRAARWLVGRPAGKYGMEDLLADSASA